MAYIINYIIEKNDIKNSSKLTIYDFGYIKGFLQNDEFIMYKIIKKEDTKEICELYNRPIPLNVISIETYDCDNYKTPNFTIMLQPYLQQPQPPQQYVKHSYHQQRQRPHQPQIKQQEQKVLQTVQPPLPLSKPPEGSFLQLGEQINEMYKKIRQEELHQQIPLILPNVPQQQQWVSLEELMRVPLPLIGQGQHLQFSLHDQNSPALLKQKHSLRVRRPQLQTVKQHQDPTY